MLNLKLYKQFYKLGRMSAYNVINKNDDGKLIIESEYHAAYDAVYAIDTEMALECHEAYCDAYRDIMGMFGV